MNRYKQVFTGTGTYFSYIYLYLCTSRSQPAGTCEPPSEQEPCLTRGVIPPYICTFINLPISRGLLKMLHCHRGESPDRRGSGGSGRSSSGSADSFQVNIFLNSKFWRENKSKFCKQSQYQKVCFQGPRQQSNKRGVLLLLAAVVVAFFICWAPFHTQRLSYVYFKHTKIYRTLNE